MFKITFKDAFYLKLGKQGMWEDELENGSKARIGWSNIDIQDIQNENWNRIKKSIDQDFSKRGKKTGATQDFNALKSFCDASEDDIFITFFDGKLYWCFLDNFKVQQDNLSKYRTTKINWSCTDIKGKTLFINQISGKISKTQGFRATLCKIEEKDTLLRIINGESIPIVEQLKIKKTELNNCLQIAYSNLHWKDYEVLTDLIFRQSGWRRLSLMGENMKYMDLELIDPITKDLFQVQVKASADIKDFENYAEKFTGKGYRKLFFVVFNHNTSLLGYQHNYDNVQLLTGYDLADLIIDLGLTNWIIDKI